ncbi:MAG: CPBP family intramembrane metalloprotease [Thermoleophilia bacterium]|nr:CPBP family intramembrane metalloprotease [Thermoleophilia bacterium]
MRGADPAWGELAAYYALACAVTWAFQSPLALEAAGVIDGPVPDGMHFAGAFGPLAAGLAVTARTRGTAGLRDLGRRMVRWGRGPAWLVVALGTPVACFLAAAAALTAFGERGAFAGFGAIAELPSLAWPVAWVVWIATFGLGEEAGWRGFALPRLQRRFAAYPATLILGAFWALWHLPSFFYNYGGLGDLAVGLPAFAVSLLAGAVVLTWLYNGSGGSILVPAVWHGTLNQSIAGAPPAVAGAVSACVIAGAIVILRRYGPRALASHAVTR